MPLAGTASENTETSALDVGSFALTRNAPHARGGENQRST